MSPFNFISGDTRTRKMGQLFSKRRKCQTQVDKNGNITGSISMKRTPIKAIEANIVLTNGEDSQQVAFDRLELDGVNEGDGKNTASHPLGQATENISPWNNQPALEPTGDVLGSAYSQRDLSSSPVPTRNKGNYNGCQPKLSAQIHKRKREDNSDQSFSRSSKKELKTSKTLTPTTSEALAGDCRSESNKTFTDTTLPNIEQICEQSFSQNEVPFEHKECERKARPQTAIPAGERLTKKPPASPMRCGDIRLSTNLSRSNSRDHLSGSGYANERTIANNHSTSTDLYMANGHKNSARMGASPTQRSRSIERRSMTPIPPSHPQRQHKQTISAFGRTITSAKQAPQQVYRRPQTRSSCGRPMSNSSPCSSTRADQLRPLETPGSGVSPISRCSTDTRNAQPPLRRPMSACSGGGNSHDRSRSRTRQSTTSMPQRLPPSRSPTPSTKLEYTFYVNDNDTCRRPFQDRRIEAIARSCQCTIVMHFAEKDPTTGTKSQPLYYKGVRVLPVTVVARSLNNLKRCLARLDIQYPHFNVKAFFPTDIG